MTMTTQHAQNAPLSDDEGSIQEVMQAYLMEPSEQHRDGDHNDDNVGVNCGECESSSIAVISTGVASLSSTADANSGVRHHHEQRAVSPLVSPPEGGAVSLEVLKKKYPTFLHTLPPAPRKRPRRPICSFVNFMGTRRPLLPVHPMESPVVVMNSAVNYVTIANTATTLLPPSNEISMPQSPAASKRKQPALEPSPYPTDAPSPMSYPAEQQRPCKKQMIVASPSPTAGPIMA